MVNMTVQSLRDSTDAIIAMNPASIIISRITEIEDTYGNKTIGRAPLAVQTMRISEITNSQSEKLMDQGSVPAHIVNVTAVHNANVQDTDRFVYLGKNYEITFIQPVTIYGQASENIYKRSGRAREITEVV